MKKLTAIALSACLALSLTACKGKQTQEAQNSDQKEIKIGIVQLAEHIALDRARQGFEDELKSQGVDAKIELVNAQGDLSITTTAPKKFAEDKVDLVYAIATPAAQGAMNSLAKTDIPVVFNAVTDPVAAGLVESLEKPGKNVTGVSDFFPLEIQLEGFLKAFPEVKTLGVLYSTDEANSKVQVEDLKKACEKFGIKFESIGVTSVNDVPTAMASLVNKIDGFFCIADNLAASSASIIGEKLADAKIPSIAAEQGPVENGILMTDGVDFEALGHEAGKMAKEIIDGKKAAEIPVFVTDKTKKVINEDVAKRLGIDLNQEAFKDVEKVK